jgi:hypothetical protein
MNCSGCGNQIDDSKRYCRRCGRDLENAALGPANQNSLRTTGGDAGPIASRAKDPDELTANGTGGVIMGDGFFMVAIILSFTNTSISSLLWLLLLIPAFFYFGKGFGDLWQAKQIRKRLKQPELNASANAELPPPRASIAELFKNSGKLLPSAGSSEKTTRELK